MKYLFNKETLLASLSVFILMGMLLLININLHPLDPVKLALTDINFNDLAFSKLKKQKSNTLDKDIIIINLQEGDRKEIALLLRKINNYKTKVIGLDVVFEKAMHPAADYELSLAMSSIPNLVISERLEWENGKLFHINYFQGSSKHAGYVNFVEEEQTVVRHFLPFEKYEDSIRLSFASAVTQIADSDKFLALKKRNNELELINYTRQSDQYFIVSDSSIVNNHVDTTMFLNKIVLIGHINLDPTSVEDKHYTPFNHKIVGKSLPDTDGVIIQANIISMIMNEEFIWNSPKWLDWLLGFLFTWLFMSLAIKYYIERALWFHIVTKVAQLILAVLIVYLGIMLLSSRVSIDFGVTLVGIILSVDVIYFYDAIAKWMHKRYFVKTIFQHPHH